VDKTFAEAVPATAIRITHHTWLAAHSDKEPYELYLQTYYMAQEIQVLLEQMYPWLAGSGYLCYVEKTPAEDTVEVACIDPFLLSSQEGLASFSATVDEKA
jgi:hypothetical protein